MVLGAGIVHSLALQDLEVLQSYLHRFDSFSIHRSRQDQRIGFQIILVGEYAVMHRLSLLVEFPDTLQHPYMESPVREGQSEEAGFLFPVLLLMGKHLSDLLLSPLTFHFLHSFGHRLVVRFLEIGRTDILGIVNILAQITESIHIVPPEDSVRYNVSVSDAYPDRRPIIIEIPARPDHILQHRYLAGLQ